MPVQLGHLCAFSAPWGRTQTDLHLPNAQPAPLGHLPIGQVALRASAALLLSIKTSLAPPLVFLVSLARMHQAVLHRCAFPVQRVHTRHQPPLHARPAQWERMPTLLGRPLAHSARALMDTTDLHAGGPTLVRALRATIQPEEYTEQHRLHNTLNNTGCTIH